MADGQVSEARYLVFETGGTKLVAGVAGEDARLLETRVIRRNPSDKAERSFSRILDLARGLKRKHDDAGAKFLAVGFGFGGLVRRSTREPYLCLHEQGWEDLPVVERLEREFGLPVAVENDCKLAALAEAHFGAGRGAETVFYMTVGTGVGGGIVRRGRIEEFSDRGEAEIGHIVVLPDGPPCWCGGRGCVESVASGPGLSRLAGWTAEREAELWASSRLASRGGDPAEASSEELFEAWERGDRFAGRVIERAADLLGLAAAAAINLIAPDVFIVGGGVADGAPRFVDLLREKTLPRVVAYFRERTKIVPSELKEQVVSQGAAILAAQAGTHPSGSGSGSADGKTEPPA